MTPAAVLFDLDGTLVDTAPDLVAVLNDMLRERGRAPIPFAIARNEVSNGARGLLGLGFGPDLPPERYAALRPRFLEAYVQNICVNSRLFIDIEALFKPWDEIRTRWGIVTNKPHALTVSLLARLGVDTSSACVISGDRLPQRKPHPAPMRLAASELDLAPEQCVYVGDAPRDIEAGKAAGMKTVAALYGYIRPTEDSAAWQADAVIRHPRETARVLRGLGVRIG